MQITTESNVDGESINVSLIEPSLPLVWGSVMLFSEHYHRAINNTNKIEKDIVLTL